LSIWISYFTPERSLTVVHVNVGVNVVRVEPFSGDKRVGVPGAVTSYPHPVSAAFGAFS
jgi:hypothetical protein